MTLRTQIVVGCAAAGAIYYAIVLSLFARRDGKPWTLRRFTVRFFLGAALGFVGGFVATIPPPGEP